MRQVGIEMAYWLFQGNPKYYRVAEAIRDLNEMTWIVTRYARDIVAGDEALIWASGKDGGIYAMAEVTQPPRVIAEGAQEGGRWISSDRREGTKRVMIRFVRKLQDQPVGRERVLGDPPLSGLAVLRQPNATNYKVTPEQWQRVQELIGSA